MMMWPLGLCVVFVYVCGWLGSWDVENAGVETLCLAEPLTDEFTDPLFLFLHVCIPKCTQ